MEKLILFLGILVAFKPVLLSAQIRPLATEPVGTTGKSTLRLELGFDYLKDVKYTLTGLEGDLFRAGTFGARFGAGEIVEIQAFWTIRDILKINRRFEAPLSERVEVSGNTTHDFGDLKIGTKLAILRENDSRPAIGFLFGTQLPNSSQEAGIGTDETNFFATALFEKRFSRVRLLGNFGLSIMGNPIDISAQNDLYDFGIAAILPVKRKFNLICDLHGRFGDGEIGTEEQAVLRFGGQIQRGGFYWDFGILTGFRETDPNFGVIVGFSRDFHFH
jgi:hypothetical protein